MAGCGGPEPERSGDGLFSEISEETGLDFHHFLGSSGELFFPEVAAAGVALLDYDRDGDLDVFLPQGTMLDSGVEPEHSAFPPRDPRRAGDRLFRNDLTSAGPRFVDVSTSSGVAQEGYGMGAAAADYDNDGDPDLYVTRFGSNVLYRNDGDGSFADVTARAGVDDSRWSSSAAFFDYDLDGDLDLFVTNYVDFTVAGARPCAGPSGQRDYCGPLSYEPLPDRLFRNDGNDRFTDVTDEAGLHAAYGSGLGAVSADFDGDGWPDLYVANDQRANQLWQNRGDDSFEEVALLSGTAYNHDGLAEASMGIGVGDFDNDGDEDLLVTHLDGETNTLYRNLGDWAFADVSHKHGLSAPSRPLTGFGTGWIDYDNDGHLDLLVANGAVKVEAALRGTPFPFQQKNQLLKNRGDGRFEDVSASAGEALQLFEVSRGLALGDLDRDGDVDAVISNCNGPIRLLRNEGRWAGNWLWVELDRAPGGGSAIGARVAVSPSGGSTLWRRAHTDGSYLSARDHRVHFGLARAERAQAEIHWLGGGRSRWLDLPVNRDVYWSGSRVRSE